MLLAILAGLVLGFRAIVAIENALQSRRRRRPIGSGQLTQLRLMSRRDAPAFAATIDAIVVAENRWDPSIREDYIRAVRRLKPTSMWAICDRRTGTIVGAITVAVADELEAEVGVWIGPLHRGRGYTSDAVPVLVRFLRKTPFTSVAASTAVTNLAMQAALRRAGFTETMRYDHQFLNGETIPAIRFSRLVEPWVAVAELQR